MYRLLIRNISTVGNSIQTKKRFLIVKNTVDYPKILTVRIRSSKSRTAETPESIKYIPDTCKKCIIKRDNNMYNFITGISLGCIIVQWLIKNNTG